MNRTKATDHGPHNPPEGSAQAQAQAAKRDRSPPEPTLVVGIGASAGGMDALRAFFETFPADSGIALAIIQHIEPTHQSQMAEILGKHTRMTVVQAADGMAIEPNSVYTIPSNKYLFLQGDHLRLTDAVKFEGIRMPIDFFLRSLAEERRERAIAIVLSGSSGADGTQGIRAVRSAGGMCIAQDPATAEFSAMPQSAIDTGLVDFVLPPGKMPAALLDYIRQPYLNETDREGLAAQDNTNTVSRVLELLLAHGGADYRHYKKGTIIRRIQRRMGIRQMTSMPDYLRLLADDAAEATQLAKDMLISVTAFFRDAEAYEELRQSAIIPLLARKTNADHVRVWIAGCATGEEAYSIAMLLVEELAAAEKVCRLHVFASDVDEDALAVARAGNYSPETVANVSPQRLERFFTRHNQHFQINKSLRELVVFARQNLLADPPFSKLDMISCRNVLIYLEPSVQAKALSVFSFGLNVGGYLFLGKSESVPGMQSVFEAVSRTARIYRLTQARRTAADLSGMLGAPGYVAASAPPAPIPQAAEPLLLNKHILKHFGAGVVLTETAGRVLRFFGDTEKYLGHPKGFVSLNVLDMATDPMASRLRIALRNAVNEDGPVTFRYVPVHRHDSVAVDVTVVPVYGRGDADKHLAVIFQDVTTPQNAPSGKRGGHHGGRAFDSQARGRGPHPAGGVGIGRPGALCGHGGTSFGE